MPLYHIMIYMIHNKGMPSHTLLYNIHIYMLYNVQFELMKRNIRSQAYCLNRGTSGLKHIYCLNKHQSG